MKDPNLTRTQDAYLPAGVSDSDSYFDMPSAGDDDHQCYGPDCDNCRELWLRTMGEASSRPPTTPIDALLAAGDVIEAVRLLGDRLSSLEALVGLGGDSDG